MSIRKLTRMNVIAYLKVTETNTKMDIGQVVDITTEGMRIQGRQQIQANTTYRFKMAIPYDSGTIDGLCFDASVIWCKESRKKGYYDAGIHLLNITKEDSEYLQQMIESIPQEMQEVEVDQSLPAEGYNNS